MTADGSPVKLEMAAPMGPHAAAHGRHYTDQPIYFQSEDNPPSPSSHQRCTRPSERLSQENGI